MSDQSLHFRGTLAKIFDDPTPESLINNRYLRHMVDLMEYTTFSDTEKQDLFNLMLLVARKLVAVWSHNQEYIAIEDKLIAEARRAPIMKGDSIEHLEYSQVLFTEFDEFLVQTKSALDHLVKIPAIIFGRNRWSMRTFGSKGKDVIKALRHNVPGEDRPAAKAAALIIENAEKWLKATIDARDKINHFIDGGINFEHFSVHLLKDEAVELLKVPMWSPQQPIRDFLSVVWENLFMLCEDFTATLLGARLRPEFAFFHGRPCSGSLESPWKVTSREQMEKETSKPGWRKG